jgi:hypothetical protein
MCQIVRRMPECLDIQVAVGGQKPDSRAFRLVMLVEAGTHLIVDAIRVSGSDRTASPREKIAALSRTRDAADVGQRTAFLCNGQRYPGARM